MLVISLAKRRHGEEHRTVCWSSASGEAPSQPRSRWGAAVPSASGAAAPTGTMPLLSSTSLRGPNPGLRALSTGNRARPPGTTSPASPGDVSDALRLARARVFADIFLADAFYGGLILMWLGWSVLAQPADLRASTEAAASSRRQKHAERRWDQWPQSQDTAAALLAVPTVHGPCGGLAPRRPDRSVRHAPHG